MSIFDQEELDENKDYLAELTGPGGKFDRTKYNSDQEMYNAIAKGKVYADRTLGHKLQEFDELREDFIKANANANAAAKYEELKSLLEQRSETDPTPNPVVNVEPALDPAKIEELLETKLAQRELQQKERANMGVVETRLKERFGENAGRILKDKMNTLGMSAEDLKFLAKRSPEAVINALGLNAQPQTYQSLPTSNQRTDNFSPTVDIRDAVFYEKMRKEKPKEYFSEKVSIQRLKDMDSPDFLKRYRELST